MVALILVKAVYLVKAVRMILSSRRLGATCCGSGNLALLDAKPLKSVLGR